MMTIEGLVYIYDAVSVKPAIQVTLGISIGMLLFLTLMASTSTPPKIFFKWMVGLVLFTVISFISATLFIPNPDFIRMLIEKRMQDIPEADMVIINKKMDGAKDKLNVK